MNPVEPENTPIQPISSIINTETKIQVIQTLLTNPKFMRFTCLGTAGGMTTRERKVQWTSVGWGQEQARGHGAEAPGDTMIISASTARRRYMVEESGLQGEESQLSA